MSNRIVNGNRLAGHGLRHEGRYWTGYRYVSGGMAPGVCECGVKSKPLPSANARKQWHREHKAEIRREAALSATLPDQNPAARGTGYPDGPEGAQGREDA